MIRGKLISAFMAIVFEARKVEAPSDEEIAQLAGELSGRYGLHIVDCLEASASLMKAADAIRAGKKTVDTRPTQALAVS